MFHARLQAVTKICHAYILALNIVSEPRIRGAESRDVIWLTLHAIARKDGNNNLDVSLISFRYIFADFIYYFVYVFILLFDMFDVEPLSKCVSENYIFNNIAGNSE